MQLNDRSGSPIIIRPIIGNMPHAGQPGALSFDGNNVTDFLKDWDMEYEEYGLTDVQKCKKLPRYCNKDIGEAIQMLQGYVNEDWTVLQQELKQLFWRTDPPKETTAALFKLIGDAKDGKINVDMYVLKYTSITNALLKRNSLSKFHQRVLLLDGLSEELQTKIFEYCSEKGWRMLEDDVETVEPDFEEVKQVVVNKARTMERWELFIDKGHKGPGCIRCFDTPITAPMVITGQASATSNSLQERTTQTAKLTSVLNGQSDRFGQQSQAPEPRSISDLDQSWQCRCMWCDSIKHR